MEKYLVQLNNTIWKSALISGDNLYLCMDRKKEAEAIENAVERNGIMTNTELIPFENIHNVQFNEVRDVTSVNYTNAKGKSKHVKLSFISEDLANEFGHELGTRLRFQKHIKKEDQLPPLVINVSGLLFSLFITLFLFYYDPGTMNDTNGERKDSGGAAIYNTIYDLIGQTGLVVLAGMASLYFLYRLYNRYTNPAREFLFSNVSEE